MKVLISILIFIIGFASGTYFGFVKAPHEYQYWNSQYKASLLAFELEALKNGRNLQPLKEIELNSELAYFGKYMESNFSWVFPYLTGIEFDPKSIKKAVEYRVNNPFHNPDLSSPDSWKKGMDMEDSFVIETIEGQIIHNSLVQKVINEYKE